MRIDSSAAKLWRKCGLAYRERYAEHHPAAPEVIGIEPQAESDSLLFGARMHDLLHIHRGGKRADVPLADARLEREAQATLAAYIGHYPVEPFEIVEAEQTRVVPLPAYCRYCKRREHEPNPACPHQHDEGRPVYGAHELVVKLDALVRNQYGALQVLDTKTQSRQSNNNDAEHWAARPQISLYIYAARLLYPDAQVSDEVILDLIRRQSPKGQEGPEFHRDTPRRSAAQIESDIRDLCAIADEIEMAQRTGFWPANRDACKIGRWRCDYFALHVPSEVNRPDVLLRDFKPAEPYLDV